nr:hypothetical protein [Clostridium felsineum]
MTSKDIYMDKYLKIVQDICYENSKTYFQFNER